MSEIPADILDAAKAIAADIPSRVRVENRKFAALVIARAIMAERTRHDALTVAVSDVLAEAEGIAMTMRRRAIFNRLRDAFAAIRNTNGEGA